MNPRPFILILAICGSLCATANPKKNPILEAAEKLDAAEAKSSIEPQQETPASDGAPILVTGTPPTETAPPTVEILKETTDALKPETGLSVRIETLQTARGNVDAAQVKLLAPFPAKPLAQPPVGWRLDVSENAPPFAREVEISPGSKITLSIRPHVLVPITDGAEVFSIPEPGYDSELGYQQTATVGAILSSSVVQLDEDAKKLGTAIDRLQQLLATLPKPESTKTLSPTPRR